MSPSSIFFLHLTEVAAKVINPAWAAASLAGQRITMWQRVVKKILTGLGKVMFWVQQRGGLTSYCILLMF